MVIWGVKMKGELGISDNIFSIEEHNAIYTYCQDCHYTYGEKDDKDTPPSGMVHNIDPNKKIYQLFADKIESEVYPDVKDMDLYRMYINCFSPAENPMFHTDGDNGITFLYYANTEEWSVDDGGETQFYMDGNIYGITPESNRLVMFDASLVHRATTFRDKYRFTVAIKYE